jgi:cleavage and polyadenylation specificity factor subunit 1
MMKQLMSFLGMLNFYRRFLPGAAKVLKPLTDFLKGSTEAAAAVEWTDEKTAAFEAAKQLLSQVACLTHPEPHVQLCLEVDASDSHIGGVLQQGKFWIMLRWLRSSCCVAILNSCWILHLCQC